MNALYGKAVMALIAVLLWAPNTYAQEFVPDYTGPKYQLDSKQENVLKIYNLHPSGANNEYCHPDQLGGRAARREFDQRGMLITGAVLEFDDGTREYVNIHVDTEAMDRLTTGWVVQGLQKLLKKGRYVTLKLYRCGASGRVLSVDAIW